MEKKWLHDMQTLPSDTFEWLETDELITYFPLSTRISLYKSINFVLNMSMLILILTLNIIKVLKWKRQQSTF